MAEPARFTLDVLLEGSAVRRAAALEVREDLIACGDTELSLETVFWVSRRAGMLLVFSREYTVAFTGAAKQLDDLAQAIDARVGRDSERRGLLEPLASEIVLCSAGSAVAGNVGEETVRGLHVAVFTQRAMHLFSKERHLRIEWPAELLSEDESPGGHNRTGVELRKDGTHLRLLYLFPEEIGALRKVAGREPQAVPVDDVEERAAEKAALAADEEPQAEDEVAAAEGEPSEGGDELEGIDELERGDQPEGGGEPEGSDEAIEMFARRDVAGPTPARLPEFVTTVETIRAQADAAADHLPEDLRTRAGLDPHFLRTHFQELGEVALGPLLLRKSAAGGAPSLAKAVEAMDAPQLQEDARAASANALFRLLDTYERVLERTLYRKRGAAKLREQMIVGAGEREALKGRFLAPLLGLAPQLRRLETAQSDLLVRLETLEEGPPDGAESDLDEAAAEWHGALIAADRGFDAAWREIAGEIEEIWAGVLLPRLAKAAATPRARMPEWVKLALIGVITTLIVATLVLVLLG